MNAEDPGASPAPEGTPPGGPPPAERPPLLRLAALGVVFLLLIAAGVILAIAERAGCLRHGPGPQYGMELPPASADSAGDWLDTADSLLAVDPSVDPQSVRRGFDMWARALAGLMPPSADTLPSAATVRALMDSLHVPGEVIDGAGDAGVLGIVFRPRTAVRTRWPYLFYRAGDRVGFMPLGLENARPVSISGWRVNGELRMAAAGVVPSGSGWPHAALVAMSFRQDQGWVPWDSLPGPDSLVGIAAAGPQADAWQVPPGAMLRPTFVEQPGEPPLLVMRRPVPSGVFEECPECPHRYLDRIWRVDGEHFVWVSAQLEDTPYAALAGFLEALPRWGREEAARYAWDASVVESAENYRFGSQQADHPWRLLAGQQAGDTVLNAVRLGSDNYRFHLQYDGRQWRVAGLERVTGPARRP